MSHRCPACGARIVPNASWCTLCHVRWDDLPRAQAAAVPSSGPVAARSEGSAGPRLTGGRVPAEVLAELDAELEASRSPGGASGGRRSLGQQILLAGGGILAGTVLLLIGMWLLGHLV